MEEPSHITRLQILSHQSKIASKIELFVGEGPTYDQARFERLGYLSLNNNQRSNYQARELKSVYLDTRGRYIRLLVHRCYINKYNLFNQVCHHVSYQTRQ
jgi:centrosomal protein CEP104